MTSREHYYVGEWLVDTRRLCVQRGTERRSAEPKVLDLLSVLAERPGYVWTRDELLDRVWPDTVVLDHALTRTVSELRSLLDDTARDGGVIETVPKRGYRLAAPVRPASPPETACATPDGPDTLQAEGSRAKRLHVPFSVPLLGRGLLSSTMPVTTRLFSILGGIGLLALLLSLLLPLRPPPTPVSMRPVTSSLGTELFPALSPDGRWMTYVRPGTDTASGGVFVTLVDDLHETQLTTGGATDAFPLFVNGGSHVAFQHIDGRQCRVLQVPVTGGTPRHVTDCPATRLGWTASPDDRYFVFPDSANGLGLRLYDRTTGTTHALTRPDGQARDLLPVFSPDARQVAFVRAPRPGEGDVYVVSVPASPSADLPPVRRVTTTGRPVAGLTWSPDGTRLVLASSSGGPFAVQQVSARGGTPQPIAPLGTADYSAPSAAVSVDRLALTRWTTDTDVWRVPPPAVAGARGRAEVVFTGTRSDAGVAVHPNDEALVLVSDRTGTRQLWIAGGDGSSPRLLARLPGSVAGTPVWTPDGSAVFAEVRLDTGSRVARVEQSGAWTWATDGPRDAAPALSADGATLFFGSQRSGTWQIWARRLPDGSPRLVTTDGGYAARTSADGTTLFVQRMTESGLWIAPLAGPTAGPARLLYAGLAPAPYGAWTLSPDGQVWVQRASASYWMVDAVDPASGAVTPVIADTTLRPAVPSSLAVTPAGALWLTVRATYESDLVVVDGALR